MQTKKHQLRQTLVPSAHRDTQPTPQWPSFTGNSQLVGTSPSGRVTVYVDPTLGQPGVQNARDLLNDADRVVAFNDAMFGTNSGTVSVIIFALGNVTDGTGGADHGGWDYVTGGRHRGVRLVWQPGSGLSAVRGRTK
jgi:hypothetical protein